MDTNTTISPLVEKLLKLDNFLSFCNKNNNLTNIKTFNDPIEIIEYKVAELFTNCYYDNKNRILLPSNILNIDLLNSDDFDDYNNFLEDPCIIFIRDRNNNNDPIGNINKVLAKYTTFINNDKKKQTLQLCHDQIGSMCIHLTEIAN